MALNKIKVNNTTTVNTGVVYDITKATGQSYDSLSAALGTNGNNVPPEVREGGMSIRFVSNDDNKYIQARCMAQNFTTDVTQWQGVDSEIKVGSRNLVESGAVDAELGILREYNTSSLTKVRCSLGSTGVWYGGDTCNHVTVPASEGYQFEIGASMGALYGWLTSDYDASNVQSDEPVPYANNTGRYSFDGNKITVTAPEGTAYLCLVTKDGAGNTPTWEVTNIGKASSIRRVLREQTEQHMKSIGALDSVIYSNGTGLLLKSTKIEAGSINTNGNNYNYSTNCIRTSDKISVDCKYISAFANLSLLQTVVSSIAKIDFNIHCYDASKNSLGRTILDFYSIENKTAVFPLLDGTKYIRVVAGFADSSSHLIDITSYIQSLAEIFDNAFNLIDNNQIIYSINEQEKEDISLGMIKIPFMVSGTVSPDGVPGGSHEHMRIVDMLAVKATKVRVYGNWDFILPIVPNAENILVNLHAYDSSKVSLGRLGYKSVKNTWTEWELPQYTSYIYVVIAFLDGNGANIDVFDKRVEIDAAKEQLLWLTSNEGILQELSREKNAEIIGEQINGIDKYIEGIVVELRNIYPDGSLVSDSSFVRASKYYSVNVPTIKVSTSLTALQTVISQATKLSFNIHCYNSTKTSLGRTTVGYLVVTDGEKSYPLPDNTAYIKFTMTVQDSENTNLDLTDYITSLNSNADNIFSIRMVKDGLADVVDEIVNTVNPKTMAPYYGERINIGQKKFDFKQLFTLHAQTVTTSRQGAAIYSKYLFQLHGNNAEIQVYDIENKTYLQTISLDADTHNHANSACFSSEFAYQSDDFPLLYVSPSYINEIYVYRISGSLPNITATLYSTITVPTGDSFMYYPQCAIDKENHKIIFQGLKVNSWQQSENNPVLIAYAELPNASQDVTMQLSDFISIFELPYMYGTQGLDASCGILIAPYGFTSVSAGIKFIDYSSGVIKSVVPITNDIFGNSFEPECGCLYNGSIIVTSQDGKVLEFTF